MWRVPLALASLAVPAAGSALVAKSTLYWPNCGAVKYPGKCVHPQVGLTVWGAVNDDLLYFNLPNGLAFYSTKDFQNVASYASRCSSFNLLGVYSGNAYFTHQDTPLCNCPTGTECNKGQVLKLATLGGNSELDGFYPLTWGIHMTEPGWLGKLTDYSSVALASLKGSTLFGRTTIAAETGCYTNNADTDTPQNPTEYNTLLTANAGMRGKVALVDRGVCQWKVKYKLARDAGAVAVIMVNIEGQESDDPLTVSQLPSNALPGFFASRATGDILRSAIALGGKVSMGPNIGHPDVLGSPPVGLVKMSLSTYQFSNNVAPYSTVERTVRLKTANKDVLLVFDPNKQVGTMAWHDLLASPSLDASSLTASKKGEVKIDATKAGDILVFANLQALGSVALQEAVVLQGTAGKVYLLGKNVVPSTDNPQSTILVDITNFPGSAYSSMTSLGMTIPDTAKSNQFLGITPLFFATSKDGSVVYAASFIKLDVGTFEAWVWAFRSTDIINAPSLGKAPVGVVQVDKDATGPVLALYVQGDRLFITRGPQGVHVYNIANPLAPSPETKLTRYFGTLDAAILGDSTGVVTGSGDAMAFFSKYQDEAGFDKVQVAKYTFDTAATAAVLPSSPCLVTAKAICDAGVTPVAPGSGGSSTPCPSGAATSGGAPKSKISASCDACVCKYDDFCCSAWDAQCQGETKRDECSAKGDKSCVSTSNLQGRTQSCFDCVCKADEWCCTNAWDSGCIQKEKTCAPTCVVSAPSGGSVNLQGRTQACFDCVCKADDWCCVNLWDPGCQAKEKACSPTCTVTTNLQGRTKECFDCVGAKDPYCTNNLWDGGCVGYETNANACKTICGK